VAAADPASDLTNPTAPSGFLPLSPMRSTFVDRYLIAEKVNDCGLNSQPWLRLASHGRRPQPVPGARGRPRADDQSRMHIGGGRRNFGRRYVNTCVTIQYPYTWQFSGASGLFGSFGLPTSITTTATVYNEN